MPHVRKQVRDAAKSDLTGLPTTGANVFTGRVSPLTASEMPGLKISIWDESSDWDTIGASPTIARTGRMLVEGALFGNDDIEDDLDQVAAEVEAKIYGATPALDALLQNIGPPTTSIDIPEPEQGNAKRLGRIRMLFPVVYRAAASDPSTIV